MSPDHAGLLDTLLACQRIQRYAAGLDGAAFLSDELRQDGMLRQLMVLGGQARPYSTDETTAMCSSARSSSPSFARGPGSSRRTPAN